ncbi:hypothetical protein Tco_1138349 [Tanacetum coccineum]
MASNQAIKYAPQCGDLTVKSLNFDNNNVVGNFSYPQTAPAYHDICKYLMNCLLAEAFTKTPLVVYQNLLREFWCIAIAYDPNPPINNSEARPLKEYLINFSVMNVKKPLILYYKTFVESTRLDYAKGTYVSHPSPEAVKAELAKIVENPILLDKTPILKTAFPVAWRILFTFVVQRKNPKSKKTPTETQVTPPTGPTEHFEQSHSVSSGNVLDLQDLERNKQLAGTGLPFMVSDEGTVKTMSLLEGPHGDKDSEGFKPLANMEPAQSARLSYQSLTKKKGKTSFEVEPDSKTLQLITFGNVQALLLFDDEMVQESNEDDVLEAGEEMDEDIPPTDEEAQSPPPNLK